MGCGGSRADAIEPRYYESWTRETESTWLTNTDTDLQLSATATATGLSPGEPDSGPEAGGLRDQGSLYTGEKRAQADASKRSHLQCYQKHPTNGQR
ncbi:brain and acute leukemia cytoplasmic protein isoform X2 [Gracilinanus agilis]|uniref:brain and acute leukemia cytoplasmic protein isoform X2 n=1 Tax=Gracilinanus agilis TaxID=191870 RepID=UPI001CFD78B3|nr:brain and acute leukemia cytoplasmic protein isoform X2 [Gracilinanus agilis]